MTGESVPCPGAVRPAGGHPLAERHNMVLASTVIPGRAVCVVTGTGMDTEVGRIAGLLLGRRGQTPSRRRWRRSKTLSFVCLCVCAVMFGGLLEAAHAGHVLTVSLAWPPSPGLPAIVYHCAGPGVARMAGGGPSSAPARRGDPGGAPG